MAIILPKSSTQQSQENLGSALGTSLQQLAQNKIQEMQQRKFRDTLQTTGLSPKIAQLVADLPPDLQKAAFQNLDALMAYDKSQMNQGAPGQMQTDAMNQTMGNQPNVEPAPSLGSVFQNPQHKIKREEMAQRERLKKEELGLKEKLHGQDIGLKEKIHGVESERKERFHAQEFGSKQEKENYKRVEPILTKAKESGVVGRKVIRSLDNILRLTKSGKAITGVGGYLTPDFLQTPEGQQLKSEIGSLVLLRGEAGGNSSVKRLGLTELEKPAIWHNPKAIEAIANKFKNDPELQREIAEADAAEELTEATQGIYPKNAVALIEKRTKELTKTKADKYRNEVLADVEKQYPAAQLAEGTETDDPESGMPLVVVDGKWTYQFGGE